MHSTAAYSPAPAYPSSPYQFSASPPQASEGGCRAFSEEKPYENEVPSDYRGDQYPASEIDVRGTTPTGAYNGAQYCSRPEAPNSQPGPAPTNEASRGQIREMIAVDEQRRKYDDFGDGVFWHRNPGFFRCLTVACAPQAKAALAGSLGSKWKGRTAYTTGVLHHFQE